MRPVLQLSATALLIVNVAACASADRREGYQPPVPADFQALSRVEAFEAMHRQFSVEYAFGAWKEVDWAALHDLILPRVERAAADEDAEGYYLALHQYLFAVPDAHIAVGGPAAFVQGISSRQSGGGFGLSLAELDDGRTIVAHVAENGPAAAAGIQAGAEVVTWGGLPVAAAVDGVSTASLAYLSRPTATSEHHRLEQVRFLTRAPVGTSVQATLRNPGEPARTVSVTAVDDAFASLDGLDFASAPGPDEDVVTAKVLPSGHGYLRLTYLIDPADWNAYPERIRERVVQAIGEFAAARVPGVVVDLRGNHGGYDDLAADLCGLFHDEPSFYEATELFDPRDGSFLRVTYSPRTGGLVDAVNITPEAVRYRGPVVALVSPSTISSGEGLAMCLASARLPRSAIVGFHGTRGSFGIVGGSIALPDGVTVTYPFGRSIDARGEVQLDSRRGVGGVRPDVRVPKTFDNVMRYARGEDVELEYAIDHLRGAAP